MIRKFAIVEEGTVKAIILDDGNIDFKRYFDEIEQVHNIKFVETGVYDFVNLGDSYDPETKKIKMVAEECEFCQDYADIFSEEQMEAYRKQLTEFYATFNNTEADQA